MKKNIGRLDRKIRIFFGFLLIIIGMSFNPIFGLVGVAFVITAFLNFCPLYIIFKLDTTKYNTKGKCGSSDCGCDS